MTRIFLRAHGIVQSVGYRAITKYIADPNKIKGFVRNAADGSVEVLAEADDASLERFIGQLHIDDGNIQVFDIETDSDLAKKFKDRKLSGFVIEEGED